MATSSFGKNFEIKTKAAGRRLARVMNEPEKKFVPNYDTDNELRKGIKLFQTIQQSRSMK